MFKVLASGEERISGDIEVTVRLSLEVYVSTTVSLFTYLVCKRYEGDLTCFLTVCILFTLRRDKNSAKNQENYC